MVLKKYQVQFLITFLLQNEDFPVKDALTSARFIRANVAHINGIEEDRKLILNAHAQKDENGNVKTAEGKIVWNTPEDEAKVNKEFEDILNEEITIGMDKEGTKKILDLLMKLNKKLTPEQALVFDDIVSALEKEV